MQITRNLIALFFWASIITLSVFFFMDNVFIYMEGYRSKIFGSTFFNNQFWVVSHLIGGTLALFLGPIQFWKPIRTKFLNFHRTSGKVYTLGALLTGFSAIRLSLISTYQPCRVSLFILAILVLFTTVAAWYCVKNKNLTAHRQFMVRSYVTVLSFVAVPIDGLYSMSFLFGDIADSTFNRTVNEYFFSFVPLLITEIIMTWLPALQRKKSTDNIKQAFQQHSNTQS